MTALATMLTALAMGLLGDRVSRRWLFRIGVTMSGLGLAVRSLLTSRSGLLAAAATDGVGFPLWHIAYVPLLSAYSREEERTHLFSVVAATWLVTGVLGDALAGILPGLYAALTGAQPEGIPAYRFALLTGAGFYDLGLLPMLLVRQEKRPQEKRLQRNGDPGLPGSTERPSTPSSTC